MTAAGGHFLEAEEIGWLKRIVFFEIQLQRRFIFK